MPPTPSFMPTLTLNLPTSSNGHRPPRRARPLRSLAPVLALALAAIPIRLLRRRVVLLDDGNEAVRVSGSGPGLGVTILSVQLHPSASLRTATRKESRKMKLPIQGRLCQLLHHGGTPRSTLSIERTKAKEERRAKARASVKETGNRDTGIAVTGGTRFAPWMSTS